MKISWFALAVLCASLVGGTAFAADEAKQEPAKPGKATLHGLVADGAVGAAKGVATGATWLVHQSPKDYAKLAASGAKGAAKGTDKAAGFSATQAKRAPGRAWRGAKWLVSRI